MGAEAVGLVIAEGTENGLLGLIKQGEKAVEAASGVRRSGDHCNVHDTCKEELEHFAAAQHLPFKSLV